MKNLVALALIVLSALAPAAFGQATDSNLVGVVLDATGAAIQNATVEIQNAATGVNTTTKSGADGQYRFNNVPVGLYNITVTASGFATSSLKGVSLELNKTATANVTLQVGTVATALEVSEAGVTIDTTTAQVGTSYESRQIVNLPDHRELRTVFTARLQLSLLSAGVASNGGVGQGTGPSVGGQRPMNNNFMIEGVDNNNKTVTGPLVYVPTEATAEFTLLQNQFGAEFGHSTGGQFNTVVQGGTNEMHGTLLRVLSEPQPERRGCAVRQLRASASNPRFDQNKLGGSVGGPIKKNKLFYFGNFEYSPLGQAFTPSLPVRRLPTAAGFRAAGRMTNLIEDELLDLQAVRRPAPSPVRTAAPPPSTASTFRSASCRFPARLTPISTPSWAVVDYNITDKDQMRGRFICNKSMRSTTPPICRPSGRTLPQRFWLATVSRVPHVLART